MPPSQSSHALAPWTARKLDEAVTVLDDLLDFIHEQEWSKERRDKPMDPREQRARAFRAAMGGRA